MFAEYRYNRMKQAFTFFFLWDDFMDEKKGEFKGKSKEIEGTLKGKAKEVEGEIKGKTKEAEGKIKGKISEMKK